MILMIIFLILTLAMSMISTNDKWWKWCGDKLLGIYVLIIIGIRKLIYESKKLSELR